MSYFPPVNSFTDVATGLNAPSQGADGSFRITDYRTAIGLNQITGHKSFRQFGTRTAMTVVATGNDVWQGTATTIPLPNQTTGEQMTVVSTSASDGVAGVGVLTLDIHYLTSTGAEATEIVTMNGTTPVNTVATNIRFIQAIHSNSVGTGGTAVGTITIYKLATAGTVYNQINPGTNVSMSSAKMVPLGKTFHMTNISVSGVDNTAVPVWLRSTSDYEDVLTTGSFFLCHDVFYLLNSTVTKPFEVPLLFPALCILKLTGYPLSTGASVSCTYAGWTE